MIATGTGRANSGYQQSNLPPYYERLEPIDGGYTLSRASGQPLGEINVFDDTEQGVIHVQFGVGRGRGTKKAVFHCESRDEFRDIVEALTIAEKQLTP
jgi:hypothetical protein